MTQARIRALLFDFGGVLAEEGFRNGLLALAREQRLDSQQMPAQGMRAVYDSGFVLGRGSAADFWQLLRQRTGLQGSDTALTQRILDGFVVRPWIIELVAQLKTRGYVTGILSDQTHWLDELDQHYHFYKHFDHIYNSYYLGKGKQDISLFSEVASALGMSPAQIVFIDDDAGNVTRAQQAGMRAIQYLDRESLVSNLTGLLQGNSHPA